MSILRTNPRREFNTPGVHRYYRQEMECKKCKQRREVTGGSRRGGFTCAACVKAAA